MIDSKDDFAFAAHKRWLLCLLGFISIIVNYHAGKASYYHLEASEFKVSCLSFVVVPFWIKVSLGLTGENYF